MDEREQRIGLNEALFREVNERVKGINATVGERFDEAEFVCECGDDACTERIRLRVSEYEEVRSHPTHFVVKEGHELREVEDVVARRDGYVVVAKRAGEPAQIARETDPRT